MASFDGIRMIDFRTRGGVETTILQEVYTNGELSKNWLYANQNRPAALERLEARGALHRLPTKHPSALRFGLGPAPKGFIKRLIGRWLS